MIQQLEEELKSVNQEIARLTARRLIILSKLDELNDAYLRETGLDDELQIVVTEELLEYFDNWMEEDRVMLTKSAVFIALNGERGETGLKIIRPSGTKAFVGSVPIDIVRRCREQWLKGG